MTACLDLNILRAGRNLDSRQHLRRVATPLRRLRGDGDGLTVSSISRNWHFAFKSYNGI